MNARGLLGLRSRAWRGAPCTSGTRGGGGTSARAADFSAVSLTSALRGRPYDALYVRKEAKDHGTARRVEGSVPTGSTVALLEDVLTTGGSSRTAIEALRAEGWKVDRVLALVDREEGAVAALAAIGVTARGLYRRGDFVR